VNKDYQYLFLLFNFCRVFRRGAVMSLVAENLFRFPQILINILSSELNIFPYSIALHYARSITAKFTSLSYFGSNSMK